MYIHIYHTNDIHAEYNTFRKIAAYLRKHKTEYDFYFDSGDFMDLKSIMVQADKGISAMELMSACRLDAMCIGNNEIDLENEAIVNLCKKFSAYFRKFDRQRRWCTCRFEVSYAF